VVAGGSSHGFALARYTQDGALDPSFGGDGRVTTEFAGRFAGAGLVIQDDGNIVVAGSVAPGSGMQRFILARYTAAGALDPTFGGNGRVKTGFAGDAFPTGIALQDDGNIVVVGVVVSPFRARSKFALARYTQGGTLDPTFGGDGKVITDFADDAFVGDIAIQADGNIVVAGSLFPAADRERFLLARYTPGGVLDPTFSGNGRVTTRFAGSAGASSVVLQDDGHIVAGGSTFSPARKNKFALARYTAGGTLDPTFGGDGKLTTGFADRVFDPRLTVQADSKVVAVGTAFRDFAPGEFAVARYLMT
jgi:uncharacterized delta-60 repeat protein